MLAEQITVDHISNSFLLGVRHEIVTLTTTWLQQIICIFWTQTIGFQMSHVQNNSILLITKGERKYFYIQFRVLQIRN